MREILPHAVGSLVEDVHLEGYSRAVQGRSEENAVLERDNLVLPRVPQEARRLIAIFIRKTACARAGARSIGGREEQPLTMPELPARPLLPGVQAEVTPHAIIPCPLQRHASSGAEDRRSQRWSDDRHRALSLCLRGSRGSRRQALLDLRLQALPPQRTSNSRNSPILRPSSSLNARI